MPFKFTVKSLLLASQGYKQINATGPDKSWLAPKCKKNNEIQDFLIWLEKKTRDVATISRQDETYVRNNQTSWIFWTRNFPGFFQWEKQAWENGPDTADDYCKPNIGKAGSRLEIRRRGEY